MKLVRKNAGDQKYTFMTSQPKNIQHSLLQHTISQKNYYICQKYFIMCIKLRVAYQKKKKILHQKYYMKINP